MPRKTQVELTNMCLVYDEHRILVQEKKGTGYAGGLVFPGGHIEQGESLRRKTSWVSGDGRTSYSFPLLKNPKSHDIMKKHANACIIRILMAKENKMEAYTSFAEVYDTFMDNVPYEQWADYLHDILKEYDIFDGLVLELGCGTGIMTELLAKKGYDMIGVDNSESMLELAMEKRIKSGHDILYLLQDMQAFELYGTVKAVVSVCDSINYLKDDGELTEVFKLVNNYLDPQGIFIFDFNTEYKYREILGDRVIAEEREECSFIWENDYRTEDKTNEYQLTLFVQSQEDSDLYRKYQEVHQQKAYTLEKIKTLIEKAGLRYIAAYDAYTKKAPMYTSGRVCVIAQEYGK